MRHSLLMLLFCCASTWGTDWNQFLGPKRDGSTDERLREDWGGAAGPRALWKRDVGPAFAGPVVAGDKLVLFHRVKDQEVVECLDAATGKVAWTGSYPTQYSDDMGMEEGPRATPAIDGGRVYTLGADGELACWNLVGGGGGGGVGGGGGDKPLWMVETRKAFGAPKGFFGMACSPLVDGGAVLVNVGGAPGAGVVAFDGKTGKVLWKATDHEAGYASPTVATIGGKRLALFLTREGLLAIEPANGRVAFDHPFRSRQHASVNAATPLVVGDAIFLSASYETGATLLTIDAGKPKVEWANDESLSNHYATSVYRDGHLYGFHGRQERGQELRCVEWKTGRVVWAKEGLGAGTVTLAHDRLLVLTERGQLVMIKAEPKGYAEVARAQVLGFNVRAYPAVSGGRVYARDGAKLVCLEIGQR